MGRELQRLRRPSADNTANTFMNQVVGNKKDAAAAGAVTDTDTLMAYIKQLVNGMVLGDIVNRATDTLPQTTSEALFTVAGGRIALVGLAGEVTTVIQTQANNTKITANPTVGTSVDLCANLNISADEVGCLYGLSGTLGDALQGINAGACNTFLRRPIIVNVGTLDLVCAASNTGSVKWTIRYVPFDIGATLVAT